MGFSSVQHTNDIQLYIEISPRRLCKHKVILIII